MERKSKPNWWVAFAIVPLMIVAILIESQFKYEAGVHEVADCAIVIVSFGLMVGWMRSNEAALMEEEIAKEHWVFTEEDFDDENEELEIPFDSAREQTYIPSPRRKRVAADWSIVENIPNKGRYN
jgi:hypothetical protein